MNVSNTVTQPGNPVLSFLLKNLSKARGRGMLAKWIVKCFPRYNNAKLAFANCDIPLDLRFNSDIGYFYGNGLGNEVFYKEVLLALAGEETVFYDIGANLGYYSFLLSSFAKQCYAFEPNPTLHQRIQDVLQRCSIKNMRVFDKAISNQNGSHTFYINSSNHGNSSLLKPSIHHKAQEVATITIDTIIKKEDLLLPTLIKIDTEGNELDILEGYASLRSHKPVLLIEWWYNEVANDQRMSRLKKILDNQYEIFRIGVDAQIKPWADNDHFIYANLLLLPVGNAHRSKIDKWL